jgi:glycerophosphoryl diester phosphodiesterase
MGTYNRRTFVKCSAMLVATAATPHADVRQDAAAPCSDAARGRPEVIAHRGGNGQWPGETMRAFREASKLKVDSLEMDVYLSADNELMLMHDPEVQSTTAGRGKVNELRSDYLQTLNAGHKWSPDGECRPFAGKSVLSPEFADLRVPKLKEVFDEFPNARMVIEMKKADRSPAAALSEMISKRGMTERVLVASFVGDFMAEFRRLSPNVATSYSLSAGDLGRLVAGRKFSDDLADPSAIQLPYQLVTDTVVRSARRRGIKVHAWTVNDLEKMYLMWDRGADGIITDYPGPMLSLLGRVGPA